MDTKFKCSSIVLLYIVLNLVYVLNLVPLSVLIFILVLVTHVCTTFSTIDEHHNKYKYYRTVYLYLFWCWSLTYTLLEYYWNFHKH
jgi:hypothetical protein